MGGELTKKILLEQGVPQGNVVSPKIFILAFEILAKLSPVKQQLATASSAGLRLALVPENPAT